MINIIIAISVFVTGTIIGMWLVSGIRPSSSPFLGGGIITTTSEGKL